MVYSCFSHVLRDLLNLVKTWLCPKHQRKSPNFHVEYPSPSPLLIFKPELSDIMVDTSTIIWKQALRKARELADAPKATEFLQLNSLLVWCTTAADRAFIFTLFQLRSTSVNTTQAATYACSHCPNSLCCGNISICNSLFPPLFIFSVTFHSLRCNFQIKSN